MRKKSSEACLLVLLCSGMLTLCSEMCCGQGLLGSSSCGGGTCHGGVRGKGSSWNSSLFQYMSRDPHRHAGLALTSELGWEIAERLTPQTEETRQQYKVKVQKTIMQRCATCHATLETATLKDSVTEESLNSLAAIGVSCESCHGPATTWIDMHVQSDWGSREDRHGMLDTNSWLSRTEGCTRCHVGSRREDGMVRDMNHDMIAAGHPPLRFDMMLYMEMLPKHWSPNSSQVDAGLAHQAACVITLQAATKLSLQRKADSNIDPAVVRPELSEFDCYACHHSIQVSRNQRSGKPQWNPWYMDGYFVKYSWALENPFAPLPETNVNRILNTKASTPMKRSGEDLQRSLESVSVNWPRDWNDVATWWTRVLPYALESEFTHSIRSQDRQRLRELLLDFSNRHLKFKSQNGSVVNSPNFDKAEILKSRMEILQVVMPH